MKLKIFYYFLSSQSFSLSMYIGKKGHLTLQWKMPRIYIYRIQWSCTLCLKHIATKNLLLCQIVQFRLNPNLSQFIRFVIVYILSTPRYLISNIPCFWAGNAIIEEVLCHFIFFPFLTIAEITLLVVWKPKTKRIDDFPGNCSHYINNSLPAANQSRD